jgi:hypothetical protein
VLDLDDIVEFVQAQTGYRKPISEGADLDQDIGVFGDDMDDLLAAYAERFDVDMASYLWYFHTGEEGLGVGSLFFKPPNRRVEHIPVTPAVLLRSARAGVWSVDYPDHSLPPRRLDVLVNQVFVAVGLAVVFAAMLWKYVLR